MADGMWDAGFVNGKQLANLASDAGARWGWHRPTLAVVDYAAERADALRCWLGQLADFAPTDAPPLRILLLERQAEVKSGWLQTALGRRRRERPHDPSHARSRRANSLPGLVASEHRRAVLDHLS